MKYYKDSDPDFPYIFYKKDGEDWYYMSTIAHNDAWDVITPESSHFSAGAEMTEEEFFLLMI